MKIVVKQNKIVLTNDNFITAGGEGELFGKGNTIYKIYHKPKNSKPKTKIRELKQLDHQYIIKPESLIHNEAGDYIGYTMDWKKHTYPLCKFITNTFRKKHNIDVRTVSKLVNNIKDGILFAHSKGFLVVDGNEFNYLVDENDFTKPYFIDVDSWQTPNFPASAVMPSIRDYNSSEFSEMSDWYAFGIVSFQLFLGIHPYKGTHPAYKKKELEERMRDNVSVFNPEVSLPRTVRDFDSAPSNYMEWYKDMFENGNRSLPPDTPGAIQIFSFSYKVSSDKNIDINVVSQFSDKIIEGYSHNKKMIIKTKDHIYVDKDKFVYDHSSKTDILFSSKTESSVKCILKNKTLFFESADFDILTTFEADDMFIMNNRCFIKNNNKFFAVDVNELSNKVFISSTASWNVLPNATKVFNGVLISNVLGKPYFTLPYILNKKVNCFIEEIPELTGYKIVNAERRKSIVVVIVSKDGQYDRLTFKFDKTFNEYKCYRDENVPTPNINFAVLDHGVMVTFNDGDDLILTSTNPDKKESKQIQDKVINSSFQLMSSKSTLMAYNDDTLYSLKLI